MEPPSISTTRRAEDDQQNISENHKTDAFGEREQLLDNSKFQPPEVIPPEAQEFINAVKNFEELTTKKNYKRLLNFVDSLGALTVIVVLVVGFWRGSWTLGDIYLAKVPPVVIIIGATTVHVILILWKGWCGEVSEKTKKTISTAIFRRVHTLLFAETCVMTFKGYWGFLDGLCGAIFLPDTRIGGYEKPLLIYSVSAASFVGLLVLKCFSNCMGPPFAISVDDRETSFNFPTMFRIKFGCIVHLSLGLQQNFVYFDKFRRRFPQAAKLTSGVVSVEEQPLMELSYLNENEILTSKPPYTEEFRNPFAIDSYQLSPRPFRGDIPYRLQPIEFPQVSVYQKFPPKNFESALAHITAYHKRKELRKKPAEEMMNEMVYKMPLSIMLNNKFNLLKPDDPREINMLSLTHNNKYNNQFDSEVEEYNGAMVRNRFRKKEKPMEVIMSIYTNPMEWRFPTYTSFQRDNMETFLSKENLKKAVLHMEVYPERDYSGSLQEIAA